MLLLKAKPIPSDWALDDEGNPTTDANKAVGLYPAAGPKGSGLAMIIDIFGSILSGMAWCPHINQMYGDLDSPWKPGHFFMAIDVRRIMPLEDFKQNLGGMLSELNTQEAAEGFHRVCYPGQLPGERREKRRIEGIPLELGLFNELAELGRSVNSVLDG